MSSRHATVAGMFDFSSAMVTPGRTIPIVLNMLSGAPTVHLECLGPDNKTYMAAVLAKANAKEPVKVGRGEKKKVTIASLQDAIAEERGDLLHAIRRLEATRTDGTPATDADIPAFIAALPPDVVQRIHAVANNIENYRDSVFADPKELAEK